MVSTFTNPFTPCHAQDGKVPVMLQQRLDVAPEIIHVVGNHLVDVVLDTVSYIMVQTYRSSGDPAVEPLPENQLQLSSDGRMLTIPRDYPLDNITVHTAAESLTLNANARAYINLNTLDGGVATLRSLRLTASGANLWVRSAVTADEAVLTASNLGHITYSDIRSEHIEKHTTEGGSIVCMDCPEEVHRTENDNHGLPVVALMYNHDLPMFASLSVGVSGWSGIPFGGLTGTMGSGAGHQFIMGVCPTGYFAFQYGINYLTRKHWSFGVGIGFMEQRFTAENARIDIVGPHILNTDLPSYYNSPQFLNNYQPSEIVWSSSMRVASIYLPLRAEWRLRSNYRGLRISAQLMPGVVTNKNVATIVRQGVYPDRPGSLYAGRIDIETTDVRRYINRFQCDLRFDVGLSNVSLFVQASLVSLFRYQEFWLCVVLPNDAYTAIHEPVYPMSIGCSINL